MDTTLLSSIVEEEQDSSTPGIRMIRMSGAPHASAIVAAVTANYNRLVDRHRPDEDDLRALIGEKVTLIIGGENLLGSGMLIAREGRLFESTSRPGGIGILPKGKRSKGFVVDPERVLDVFEGWVTDRAKTNVENARTEYPELRPITQERLEQLPRSWDEQLITFCAFGSYDLPDCRATDSIVMFAEYDDVNDILDTGVVLVRPEFGTSEHGSMYGRDLLRMNMGEVVGFEPITFSEAIKLCNLDFDEAFDRVVGRAVVRT